MDVSDSHLNGGHTQRLWSRLPGRSENQLARFTLSIGRDRAEAGALRLTCIQDAGGKKRPPCLSAPCRQVSQSIARDWSRSVIQPVGTGRTNLVDAKSNNRQTGCGSEFGFESLFFNAMNRGDEQLSSVMLLMLAEENAIMSQFHPVALPSQQDLHFFARLLWLLSRSN